MPYNYPHPEWKEEDRKFIEQISKDIEYFKRMARKYVFDLALRKPFEETETNLNQLYIRLLNEFEETYEKEKNAETHNRTP